MRKTNTNAQMLCLPAEWKKHWIRRLQTIFHVDTKLSFVDPMGC
jgi:hypothetical protein